ncbi:ActS/PrrB/RegB family redox-sensitive histidine kinase [Microvirga sp. W0021]|uniref:histidine kinase n=1 Tax=Hohaiivirga grylli TaxID=3133970 RepID=A0ABV0BFG0_9HYPH
MGLFSAISIFKNIFPDYSRGIQNMRVNTLVRLRWLAIFGQTITVLGVQFGFGFEFPFWFCLYIVALSALLNIFLKLRLPTNFRLNQSAVTLVLAFDILQLAGLLYLTGGLQNPFSILFLAPVLISATALSPERTLVLGLIATGCTTLLALIHEPLPWNPYSDQPVLPFLFISSIWLSLFISMVFISIYAWQVGAEARQLAGAVSAMELVIEREQHLTRLDGLAAAAAHELGTPLATIALIAKELSNNPSHDKDTKADLELLREQVVRCREILGQLTSLGRNEDSSEFLSSVTIRHLIEETVTPLQTPDTRIDIDISGIGKEPRCVNKSALIFSLTNIIDNALDYAETYVSISAYWDESTVSIEIRDDGQGYAPDVLSRLGEPYVTTRSHNRDTNHATGESGGLGLGLFITKTLIERSGAILTFSNAVPPDHGAVTRIVWERHDFEQETNQNLIH